MSSIIASRGKLPPTLFWSADLASPVKVGTGFAVVLSSLSSSLCQRKAHSDLLSCLHCIHYVKFHICWSSFDISLRQRQRKSREVAANKTKRNELSALFLFKPTLCGLDEHMPGKLLLCFLLSCSHLWIAGFSTLRKSDCSLEHARRSTKLLCKTRSGHPSANESTQLHNFSLTRSKSPRDIVC